MDSEKAMTPHSSTLALKSHGQRNLVSCNPWGHEESDTTEQLHFHFSLSCVGEGNGNPLGVLAWGIPLTAEPGGLPSVGSHRVGHDWSNLAAAAAAAAATYGLSKWFFRWRGPDSRKHSQCLLNPQNNPQFRALSCYQHVGKSIRNR